MRIAPQTAHSPDSRADCGVILFAKREVTSMTWYRNVETFNGTDMIFVHQLLDDETHELIAEVDLRGIVLYADSRSAPKLRALQ